MAFVLQFTSVAETQYEVLSKAKGLSTQFKAVKKALRLLEQDPRHPGLHTHKYSSLTGPNGVEVFEAYAQNKTPGAYRIFWCYYPPKTLTSAPTITIVDITPHP